MLWLSGTSMLRGLRWGIDVLLKSLKRPTIPSAVVKEPVAINDTEEVAEALIRRGLVMQQAAAMVGNNLRIA